MGPKILVIDDSALMRRNVASPLTSAGFSVIEATNGVEGLVQLVAHPDTRVIFCDLNMPAMGGIELLEALNVRGDKTAVVIMSSDSQISLVDRACALGAKAWIVKPFRTDVVVNVARKLTNANTQART